MLRSTLGVPLAVGTVMTFVVVMLGVARAPGETGDDSGSHDRSAGAVVGGPFCSDITDTAVVDALGESATATEYTSGQRTALEPGLTDVPQEYGCSFTGDGGEGRARAWVFAAPVTTRTARRLAADVARPRGCEPIVGDGIGRLSAEVACTGKAGNTVVRVGLVDHTWVHCELERAPSVSVSEVTQRAKRWCDSVVAALRRG